MSVNEINYNIAWASKRPETCEWRIPQPEVKWNVISQNTVVSGIETCLDPSFLLLKSRILREKRKLIDLAIRDFPAAATRQQGAPLSHHEKYFAFFFDGKFQQNCGP